MKAINKASKAVHILTDNGLHTLCGLNSENLLLTGKNVTCDKCKRLVSEDKDNPEWQDKTDPLILIDNTQEAEEEELFLKLYGD